MLWPSSSHGRRVTAVDQCHSGSLLVPFNTTRDRLSVKAFMPVNLVCVMSIALGLNWVNTSMAEMVLPTSNFSAVSQRPVVPVLAPPKVRIEWNNRGLRQQQALNQFYRSIDRNGHHHTPRLSQPSLQRQQQVQQLRQMTPQQRQQLFLNYIQQTH